MKGRKPNGANGNAKLTTRQVVAIIDDVRSQRVIAAAHGINQQQVSKIKSGRQWAHVVASDTRKFKRWDFTRLMAAWPLHGALPATMVASKVVTYAVDIERDGHGLERIPSWMDDLGAV